MRIEKIDQSRESFSDYQLKGTTLTIGGIPVDLESEQREQEIIIVFSDSGGTIQRGMKPCCKYVAEVIIPPRRFEEMEAKKAAPGTPKKGKEKKDEEHESHTESAPVPLDIDSVVLRLWPVEVEIESEEQLNEQTTFIDILLEEQLEEQLEGQTEKEEGENNAE